MIVARTIQGLGGAIFPLAFGIVRDEFPRERVASAIALISGILGIGGGLGIVLAGPILENLNYHWLFWIPLVVTLISMVATIFLIPESSIRAPGDVHWLGAILLSGWLVALLVAVSEASTLGLGLGEDARAAGARGGDRGRLDLRRAPLETPARRHEHDAAAGCLDDEPRRLPDRLRDVQRVHPDPAVRAGAEVDRVRLRRDGHARPGCS